MNTGSRAFWIWLLSAGIMCAAGVWWSASLVAFPGLKLRAAPRALSVYPRQEIPLRFSHKLHLAKGMSCASCHADATQSEVSSDRLLPPGKSCDACHGTQHPLPPKGQAHCGDCHQLSERGTVARSVVAPPARLRFSHKAHKDAPCSRCHGDLSQVDLATRDHLPTESTCLGCHDGKKQSNACQLCHPQNAAGRLNTRSNQSAGMKALIPVSARRGPLAHDLRFVYDHAAIANAQRDQCMSCHTQSFCADCHGNGTRPMQIHPAGYLGTHGIDASARTETCMSCHQRATDCRSCHLRLGISDARSLGLGPGHSNQGQLSFHPAGYATPAGEQLHAADARKNISACASCHSEDTCLSCHATSQGPTPGLSANPHGPSFVDSGRCAALAGHNRRVCLKCHAPSSPQLDCAASGRMR